MVNVDCPFSSEKAPVIGCNKDFVTVVHIDSGTVFSYLPRIALDTMLNYTVLSETVLSIPNSKSRDSASKKSQQASKSFPKTTPDNLTTLELRCVRTRSDQDAFSHHIFEN